jgi:lipoprotein-releasing system permease protein
MAHPFEVLTGLRYTRAKRRSHFVSFITTASIIGVALSVIVLITVMSVMNGFETQLRTRILGAVSHATISGGPEGVANWPTVAAEAAKNPQVVSIAPYVEGPAMVRSSGDLSPALIRGVLPAEENKVSDFGVSMKAGTLDSLTAGSYNIVIGQEMAQDLHVDIGDRVDLLIAQATVTPAGVLPRFRRFTISGVFGVGVHEYDSGLVLLNLEDAAALLRLGENVSGLRIKLRELFDAPKVARELATDLARDNPDILYVSDWTRGHANFFQAVATEKIVMFLILSFLVGIAAFNIVSTLVMVVQDKQADIAILRTLGATPRSIMLIFMIQGTVIGVIGTVIGVGLGVLLALNVQTLVPLLEAATGHKFLSPDIYYISFLPSELKASDVIGISVLSLALGLLSTLYPAWRASKVQPAEALRYE